MASHFAPPLPSPPPSRALSATHDPLCTGIAVITAILVRFSFILVPLTLAYFITFLLVPLMNVFEQRPLKCGKKEMCAPKENAKRFVRSPPFIWLPCSHPCSFN